MSSLPTPLTFDIANTHDSLDVAALMLPFLRDEMHDIPQIEDDQVAIRAVYAETLVEIGNFNLGWKDGCYVVAIDRGTGERAIVGCIRLEIYDSPPPGIGKVATASRLYVHPAYRGQRIGRDLIRLVLGMARKRGVMVGRIMARPDNGRVMRTYKRMGFRELAGVLTAPLEKVRI